MTVATVRPDGWPQATTVGYASEGLVLYFLCARQSQKAANITADNRISLTIDHDTTNPMAIEGLSMGGRAYPVAEPSEIERILELMGAKFPEYLSMPRPDPAGMLMLRVMPEVISILDYRKGFGHSDLIEVTEADRAIQAPSASSREVLISLLSIQHGSNWQLRPLPKFRSRKRPLAGALQLGEAY
jgi:nitroimidazol reductase NimA-like FMN-containing flavoprotein (pyridoxamine 5'-phosphate oxidase superfamily)